MLKQFPINRNSQRSIELITGALFELLKTDSFQDISITKITQKAGVVRNTFYAHFQKKEDVMSFHILGLFKREIDSLNKVKDSKNIDLIAIYFNFWKKHIDLLELLKSHNLLELLNSFESNLDELNIKESLYELCDFSDEAMKYANSIYMNVMTSMLRKWINTGKEESPEQLTKIFYELFYQ